ncbi:hypothetical protein GCM10010193_12030 [Kitasatospora atroaurantiaca]|uniref:Putative hydrolase of the HAD superfamily n=1 Tax=Kitasatospora atroaurantiaca TaxID=285545 RepID=A0A561EQM0_9ACTN|nr:HAD family hydrolase [Kitasatospora atroaurantiaca]TWE17895.1 putative hydrolase of the HAD superfamily [Kitasatospora atroaurantiaca]
MQRLVLIDLDHTLIERHGTSADWAAEFCATYGLHPDTAQSVYDTVHARPHPETFARLSAEYGLPLSGEALWERHVDGQASRVRRIPGVTDGLRRLRAGGWTVVVVTNGSTPIQSAKLARAGLRDAVDAVCISEEAGSRKPDPAIFHLAATRSGHDPSAGGWMVGNNPATDILGAQAAGLRSVWISAGHPWQEPHPAPDHAVRDVAEAADLLLSL